MVVKPLVRSLAEAVLTGEEAAPGAFLDALQEFGGMDTTEADCREEVANLLIDLADLLNQNWGEAQARYREAHQQVIDCLQRYFPEALRQLLELDSEETPP